MSNVTPDWLADLREDANRDSENGDLTELPSEDVIDLLDRLIDKDAEIERLRTGIRAAVNQIGKMTENQFPGSGYVYADLHRLLDGERNHDEAAAEAGA